MRHSVNNNCSQVNCSNLCATPFGSEMSCTERHALQKAFEKLIEPTGMESFISETREALFLITYYILINQTGNEENMEFVNAMFHIRLYNDFLIDFENYLTELKSKNL